MASISIPLKSESTSTPILGSGLNGQQYQSTSKFVGTSRIKGGLWSDGTTAADEVLVPTGFATNNQANITELNNNLKYSGGNSRTSIEASTGSRKIIIDGDTNSLNTLRSISIQNDPKCWNFLASNLQANTYIDAVSVSSDKMLVLFNASDLSVNGYSTYAQLVSSDGNQLSPISPAYVLCSIGIISFNHQIVKNEVSSGYTFFYIESSKLKCVNITVEVGNTLTLGTVNELYTAYAPSNMSACYDTSASKFLVAFTANSLVGGIVVTQTDANTYSATSKVDTAINSSGRACSLAYSSTDSKSLLTFSKSGDQYITSVVGTISAGTLSWGATADYDASTGSSTFMIRSVYNSTASTFVIVYANGNNGSYRVCGLYGITISGTTITTGSGANYLTATSGYYPKNAFVVNVSGKYVCLYGSTTSPSSKFFIYSVESGRTFSLVQQTASEATYYGNNEAGHMIYDSSAGKAHAFIGISTYLTGLTIFPTTTDTGWYFTGTNNLELWVNGTKTNDFSLSGGEIKTIYPGTSLSGNNKLYLEIKNKSATRCFPEIQSLFVNTY